MISHSRRVKHGERTGSDRVLSLNVLMFGSILSIMSCLSCMMSLIMSLKNPFDIVFAVQRRFVPH